MLKWLINNMRRGFATNSSSSHSMVHFKNPISSDNTSFYGNPEFGWDDFTLTSLGEKLMYALVAHLSHEGYSRTWYQDPAEDEVTRAMEEFGHLFPEFPEQAFRAALQGYIDHQSMPSSSEALKAARDPHIMIVGGNDNGGTTAWNLVDEYAGSDEVDWISSTDDPSDKYFTDIPKKDQSQW